MGLRACEGQILRLRPSASLAVAEHLFALSADDRYRRFAGLVSDAALSVYVNRLDFERDICFGYRDGEAILSGFIHVSPRGPVADLGASVLAAYRRRGLARRLFAWALQAAAECGVQQIQLATGHPVARHICRQLGYACAPGEVHPAWRVDLALAKSEQQGCLQGEMCVWDAV